MTRNLFYALLNNKRNSVKIIFMGTPEFALDGLERLVAAGVVVAVITRPDRPAGRGKKPSPPPVKTRAEELGLKVFQPADPAGPEIRAAVREIEPDLFVVSAYGKFIPATLLRLAERGGINLHPSLLPRYRGAAPIQWALINGERKTGVSVISVARRMDAGNIWGQKTVAIDPEDNAETLSRRLAREGGILLAEVVGEMERGEISPRPQDENLVTLAPRLTKEDGRIDWNLPASELANRIRGLYPWPGSFTSLTGPENRTLKILAAEPVAAAGGRPGEILRAGGEELLVAAGEGALKILRLQLEGKRPLGAGEFLRGRSLRAGEVLDAG
jgi:methionyl-tRNA formyltransferase